MTVRVYLYYTELQAFDLASLTGEGWMTVSMKQLYKQTNTPCTYEPVCTRLSQQKATLFAQLPFILFFSALSTTVFKECASKILA